MPPDRQDQRQARRLANDLAIRAAALDEAHRRGLDALGPTAVARAAGLTTGAVYARHEDATELLVDLWTSTLGVAVGAFLADAAGLVGGSPADRQDIADRLGRLLGDPPPELVVGCEALVVARRNRALAEVVHPDIVAILDQLGAGQSTSDPDRHAKVALASIVGLGLVLIGQWGPAGQAIQEPVDWPRALGGMGGNLQGVIVDPPVIDPADRVVWFPGPGDLDTDVTKARLLLAAMEVIATSGVERATTSRIARRAGFSHGAIYGLFENKEALVADTVRIVSDRLSADDVRRGLELVARRGTTAGTLAALYFDRLSDERQRWHHFRLECLTAARWSPEVAASLDGVLTPMLAAGAHLFEDLYGSEPPLARAQRQMLFAASPGYSVLSTVGGLGFGAVEWWRSAGLLLPTA